MEILTSHNIINSLLKLYDHCCCLVHLSVRIFYIVLYSFLFLFVYELNSSFVPILYCSYIVQFIYLEKKAKQTKYISKQKL